MEVIHYICHYNALGRRLETQPSGVTKINYIKLALKQAGFKIKLYSVAEGNSSKFSFYPAKYLFIDNLEEEYYISTWGRVNIVLKFLSRIWMLLQLFFYLISKVHAGEYVLVYHSLAYDSLFSIYKKWINKNCKLIYEVEEIYSAVSQKKEQSIFHEIEHLRSIASGYILVNDIMATECHFRGRKAVCYGTYELSSTKVKCISDNGLIHIVYAGVIGDIGSDAFLAVKIAKFLSPRYIIHLLGYGSDDNIILLKKTFVR